MRSSSAHGKGSRALGRLLPPGWRGWLLRAALVYVSFNLLLNLALALTRPLDLPGLFVFGKLNARTEAAWLLARHEGWHDAWEDEGNIPALIEQEALAVGIDPLLLKALVEQESGGRVHAISPVGACGLTQLMPATARELGVQDIFHPRENLNGGARYLARLLKSFRQDLSLALAAYNAGPGAVTRAGGIPPFRETRQYVERISSRFRAMVTRREGGKRPAPAQQHGSVPDAVPDDANVVHPPDAMPRAVPPLPVGSLPASDSAGTP